MNPRCTRLRANMIWQPVLLLFMVSAAQHAGMLRKASHWVVWGNAVATALTAAGRGFDASPTESPEPEHY